MMQVEKARPFTEPRSPENFGITLSKYFQVALALNRFPENVDFTLNDLAEEACVHRNTTKKALFFLGAIRPIIPEFNYELNNRVRVKQKPKAMIALDALFLSHEVKISSKLLLKKATSRERGLSTDKLEKILNSEEVNYLTKLIQRGLVNSEEGYFYLSSRGALVGNIGIRKLVDSGIPLPWEEIEEPQEPQVLINFEKMPSRFEPITISTWETLPPWGTEPTYITCFTK